MAKLNKITLSDQIKDLLVSQIIDGTLKPGDRLLELSIAKEAGTSQAPVREALRQLEALGLITFRSNRGATVREIDAVERAEIYAVRAELEGFAAFLVATTLPRTGDDLLTLCNRMDAAVAQGDTAAFVDLNTAFHRKIVEASGNRTLLEIWDRLDIQMRTTLNTARAPETPKAAIRDHRVIAHSIGEGRAEDARATMVAHINAVAS